MTEVKTKKTLRKYPVIKVGRRFGRFTVIELCVEERKSGNHFHRCKCDCGNIKIVRDQSLKKGLSKSCGCYRSELLREKMLRQNEKAKLEKEEEFILNEEFEIDSEKKKKWKPSETDF